MTFKINKRFEELHRPLTPEEFKELEASIKEEGINDPLIIWRDTIIDGHHRNKIAKKLKIEPPFKIRTFEDEAAVEKWILRLQLGRRNLSALDFKLAVGRLYNVEKNSQGGDKKSNRQNDGLISDQEKPAPNAPVTAAKVADETGVSPRTVERSGKYAEAFDKLPKSVKTLIEEKPSRATEAAVLKMADMPASELVPIARDVRVGNVARFDDLVKPSKNGLTKAGKKKTGKGQEKESPAKLIDTLTRSHISPLVKGIDKVALLNGGKGAFHTTASGALDDCIRAMKEMRKGEK